MAPHDSEVFRIVRANLVSVVEAPTAADYQALHDLVAAHGSGRVARIHHAVVVEHERAGEWGWPALGALADTDRVMELVLGDGQDPADACRLAETAFRQACLLVIASVERERGAARATAAPTLVPVPEGFDLRRWRAVVTPVVAAPWAPYADRLVARAAKVSSTAGRIARECRDVCRSRETNRERTLVATEIRRLVAETGLSQREFAPYVGTSASRLSTYATGRVVPSAAMMLRIQQVARSMAVQSRRPPPIGARSAS